ncbi:MAG: serine/threonine-protein kinase [Polyangiaceae bacterium]
MRELTWMGRLVASRYRVIARLGEGQMTEVYLARHVLIDRLSAIKILRPEMGRDARLRKLFLREAKAVNRINHPNIVEITDYGETVETAFLVMEYVPGESLARLLAPGPLGWVRAARIGLQIGLALSRAHEMGVIHRDIKPSNVLVVERRGGNDLVKLTDFGVAKLLEGDGRPSGNTTGMLPKQLTPGYVAPELRLLGRLDARSDLFSLGVLLYETACGVLPYDAEQLISEQPPPRPLAALGTDCPERFDAALSRLLAPDPDDRPRDAFEAVAMFRKILSDSAGADLEETDDEPPTERMPARPKAAHKPKLATMPFERIGPLCERALTVVEAAAKGQPGAVGADELQHARDLVLMATRLHDLVTLDARSLAALEERARCVRQELGSRLDQLGLERSRAMGWAGAVAERSEFVRAQRLSGAHPIRTMDALLWEEATLDREEDISIAHAEELGKQIAELSSQLELTNEALEREKASLEAKLEGHVAALRALAAEVWLALEALSLRLLVPLPTEP